jgi:hypothetical protein
MKADNAPANLCVSFEIRRGGDTGRRRAEHRSILQLMIPHHKM